MHVEEVQVRCVKWGVSSEVCQVGVSSEVCQVVLPPLEEGACVHVRCVNMRCVGIGE